MVRFLVFLVLSLAVMAAPASADVGGFSADDGNRSCEGSELDWDCVGETTASDASGGGDDTVSGKEDEPGGWSIGSGSASGKNDFTSLSYAVREDAENSYLFLSFDRADASGNASVSFELNQLRTRMPNGAPCRQDGDVLIAFDGGAPASMTMYRWVTGTAADGCAANGAWQEPETVGAEGTQNGTFAEVAIDLDAVATAVGIPAPCAYFTSLAARSRASGSSTQANLDDFVAAQGISAAACKDPGGGEPPQAPSIVADGGCTADGTVTLSGTADADTVLVQVREGDARLGQAVPDAEGDWTLTLEDVADGDHTYSAYAYDADANESDPASASTSTDATDPVLAVYAAAGGTDAYVAGLADPGATVDILEGATKVASATADDEGNWSATFAAAAGRHTYTARSSDDCATTTSAPFSITIGSAVQPPPPGGTDGPGTGGVLPETDACITKPFRSFISKDEKKVRRATFFIDGKKVRTVRKRDKKGRFAITVQPAHWRGGTHQITAKLKIKGRKKLRKVNLRTFAVCDLGKCVSRRVFKIRVKEVPGDAVVRATVRVNGKKVKTIRGAKRLRAKIDLRGLPKGVVVVKIRAVTASGKIKNDTRRYRTCGLKKTKKG